MSTPEEIIIDEDTPLDVVVDLLIKNLEDSLEYIERLKPDATAFALNELTLQAVDISLLIRERLGDVVTDLDFDLDEDETIIHSEVSRH